MNYVSTRDNSTKVTSAQAIAAGETEETARGKYLITIADMIASGKEI